MSETGEKWVKKQQQKSSMGTMSTGNGILAKVIKEEWGLTWNCIPLPFSMFFFFFLNKVDSWAEEIESTKKEVEYELLWKKEKLCFRWNLVH